MSHGNSPVLTRATPPNTWVTPPSQVRVIGRATFSPAEDRLTLGPLADTDPRSMTIHKKSMNMALVSRMPDNDNITFTVFFANVEGDSEDPPQGEISGYIIYSEICRDVEEAEKMGAVYRAASLFSHRTHTNNVVPPAAIEVD